MTDNYATSKEIMDEAGRRVHAGDNPKAVCDWLKTKLDEIRRTKDPAEEFSLLLYVSGYMDALTGSIREKKMIALRGGHS